MELLQRYGGITKPQRGAWKASGPISLHTYISEEVQKQLADTPDVEKEEAREVGLCREVHLGLQMLWKSDTVPYRESKRVAIWDYSIEKKLSTHRIENEKDIPYQRKRAAYKGYAIGKPRVIYNENASILSGGSTVKSLSFVYMPEGNNEAAIV